MHASHYSLLQVHGISLNLNFFFCSEYLEANRLLLQPKIGNMRHIHAVHAINEFFTEINLILLKVLYIGYLRSNRLGIKKIINISLMKVEYS